MLSASLLGAIKKDPKEQQQGLRSVPQEERRDRSAPAASTAALSKAPDVDETKMRNYFFNSGAETWYDDIADRTFSSTFCELTPKEAKVIVDHWQNQQEWLRTRDNDAAASLYDPLLLQEAVGQLGDLVERLDKIVEAEKAKSSVGRAFVKLSTRSPKDSAKVLANAAESYHQKISAMDSSGAIDGNMRWRILSEEVAKASAVSNGMGGLELLLDSARVFEDLEYALQGQSESSNDDGAAASSWNVSLVARAWDPRIRPETEFRGICWNGKLTCLNQYFHPLWFPELVQNKDDIERDILECVESQDVQAAIAKLGGCCIVDFARLAPGEVMIIELNPFDGLALGTFPASTGLFLWDDPNDRKIMKGEAPFEFRIREQPMEEHKLKADFNKAWRAIVYNEED